MRSVCGGGAPWVYAQSCRHACRHERVLAGVSACAAIDPERHIASQTEGSLILMSLAEEGRSQRLLAHLRSTGLRRSVSVDEVSSGSNCDRDRRLLGEWHRRLVATVICIRLSRPGPNKRSTPVQADDLLRMHCGGFAAELIASKTCRPRPADRVAAVGADAELVVPAIMRSPRL